MDSAAINRHGLETLWSGLPRSHLRKQRKLAGIAEDGIAVDPSSSTEPELCQAQPIEIASVSGIDARLLCACHLLLQWYVDDLESVIGVFCESGIGSAPERTVLRVTHVYAEDEDSVESVLAALADQLGSRRFAQIGCDPFVYGSIRHSPIFYYRSGREGFSDVAAGCPVLIAAAIGSQLTTLGISMLSTVAQALPVDDFAAKCAGVVRWLGEDDAATAGSIRARLGTRAATESGDRSSTEQRVIQLWAELLEVPVSELTDESSYFDVGGTSLNAFRLVNRLRVEFHREVSIRDIVENPTVRDLAGILA